MIAGYVGSSTRLDTAMKHFSAPTRTRSKRITRRSCGGVTGVLPIETVARRSDRANPHKARKTMTV